ncbi:hypothetical protein ACJX0J_041803, partial [Zea mays]
FLEVGSDGHGAEEVAEDHGAVGWVVPGHITLLVWLFFFLLLIQYIHLLTHVLTIFYPSLFFELYL